MPLYIVRPRLLRVSSALSLSAVSVAAGQRKAQIQVALRCRLDDPVDQELGRWLGQAKPSEIRLVTMGETHTPVTGTTIVEMTAEAAQRLSAEVPDLVVLRPGAGGAALPGGRARVVAARGAGQARGRARGAAAAG